MPKVAVYDITGKAVGEIELSDNIFGQEVNANVLHEVVKAYLANQRQGTQSALTRAEVSGGVRRAPAAPARARPAPRSGGMAASCSRRSRVITRSA